MLLRTSRLVGLLSAVLTLNAPATAAAQGTDTTTERALLVSKLALRSGTVVRIARPDFPHVQGRLVRATDHTLVLMDGGSEHTVPVNVADSVWTGSGSTKRGAIWGGLVGLLPGAIVYAYAKGMCGDAKCEGGGTVVALGVGAVGAGALLGALVGSMSEWRRRYP